MRRLAPLLVFLLAGCAGSSAILDGAGDGSASSYEHAQVTCGASAMLHLHLGLVSNGTVRVVVTDGGGAAAFQQDYSEEDSEALKKRLDGAAGTWAITLMGDGYVGRYSIELEC